MHDAPSTALIVKRKPCQSRRESILVSRATGQPCQSVFRRGDTQATATPRSRVPTGKMDGCISIFAWNTARICNFQIHNRKKKEHRHAIHIGVLWWRNDSRNDTIHGFHCALGLSFYIGCIWVQTGCSRVQNWLGGCNGELLLYYLLSTDNNISTFPLIFFQAVFASQIKKGNGTAEITPLA